MSWTSERDLIFCREILVSNLFNTRKSSTERGKVWESIADKLCDIRQPTFRVDQRSVRDHYKKLVGKFKRKVREELNASGISPEQSELDVMLEEIVEREDLAEAEKENEDHFERRKAEADRMAADDVRRQAMETLSETQKRKAGEGEECMNKKRRRSGDDAVAYLRQKAEMEMEIRKEEMEVKKAEVDLEKNRQQQQMEQQAKMFEQQANMMKVMMEQQQRQQQQIQAMQMVMLQQQQQQNQALMVLFEKLNNV